MGYKDFKRAIKNDCYPKCDQPCKTMRIVQPGHQQTKCEGYIISVLSPRNVLSDTDSRRTTVTGRQMPQSGQFDSVFTIARRKKNLFLYFPRCEFCLTKHDTIKNGRDNKSSFALFLSWQMSIHQILFPLPGAIVMKKTHGRYKSAAITARLNRNERAINYRCHKTGHMGGNASVIDNLDNEKTTYNVI